MIAKRHTNKKEIVTKRLGNTLRDSLRGMQNFLHPQKVWHLFVSFVTLKPNSSKKTIKNPKNFHGNKKLEHDFGKQLLLLGHLCPPCTHYE